MDRYRAGKRLWSAEDDQALRDCYPHVRTTTLAAVLRRTLTATYGRARLLALAKSPAYLESPAACRLRRAGDEHPGRATQFTKGHVSPTKGLRRPGYGPGRMKTTQFKPGGTNHNVMPIGSTRLVEGYVYRKVSAVRYVPYTVNWKPEHHLIWIAARGPIPPGHALRFTNGNRLDVRLDNLELITRRALLARNSIHTLPPVLAETVRLLASLNRQLRRRDDHAREKQD